MGITQGIDLDSGAGIVFGTQKQFASTNPPQDTTSATFASFLTMVTPVVPAGEYRLGVAFRHEASNASTEGEYELRVDGVPVTPVASLRQSSAGERKTYSSFGYVPIAAGAHTVEVMIRRSAGSGAFTVRNIRLEAWRTA